MRPGWHRTLGLLDKITLLREFKALHGVRRRKLVALGIPASTYYRWQRLYRDQGGDGLQAKRRAPKRIWNRLSADEAIMRHARTPHTALKNVSPIDVYMGRWEDILQRRAEKKLLTLERQKMYDIGYNKEGEQP